jgi:hypothetical protein
MRGKHLDRGGVLELLAVAPTPAALCELGADGMREVIRPRSPRPAKSLPAKILAALDAQTVVVPGTNCVTSTPNAPPWPPTSRPAWKPALLPRS